MVRIGAAAILVAGTTPTTLGAATAVGLSATIGPKVRTRDGSTGATIGIAGCTASIWLGTVAIAIQDIAATIGNESTEIAKSCTSVWCASSRATNVQAASPASLAI